MRFDMFILDYLQERLFVQFLLLTVEPKVKPEPRIKRLKPKKR